MYGHTIITIRPDLAGIVPILSPCLRVPPGQLFQRPRIFDLTFAFATITILIITMFYKPLETATIFRS